MPIRRLLLLGLMLAHPWVSAQTAAPVPPLTLDEARVQRSKAKTLKDEAEKTFALDKAACSAKAIAIGCMSSARERRAAALQKADALEREGRNRERELRRAELEAKAAKRAAEAPAEQARQEEDAAQFREKKAQRAAERERLKAEHATQLEARRSKAAAEREAKQRRQAELRQEDARRAAESPGNAKKRAERERAHAEKVRKIDERAKQYADLLKRREAEQAAKQSAAAAK